jgi:hypothetical protein
MKTKNVRSSDGIICVAFLFVVWTIGCHPSVDAASAKKAREWIRQAPSPEWGDSLDRSRWRVVLDSKELTAEELLQTTSAVPLTDKLALELTGQPPIRPRTNTKPFLIRAVGSHVGTAGFEIYTNANNDVTVIGAALSHFPISPERRPIVVWMETPPREIYLWFTVAA